MTPDVDQHSRRTSHRRWMNAVGQQDLASIIIPTYNRASLLNEALASVAAQTYRPLEIIIVDDGSSDDTPAVVNHWREQFKNDSQTALRYFHQSNSGVGSARNRGLIEAKGDFIQFLDSDDILNSRKLSLHIDALRRYPQCGYIFSDWTRLESPMKWAQIPAQETADIDSAELFCSPRVSWTMVGLYRRNTCYVAGPYSEDMASGEDKEFNFRVLLSTGKVAYLPGELCASRDHAGPRITDVYRIGQNNVILAMRLHKCMAESAAARGRLNDPRIARALANGLSSVILDALNAGRRDLAREAVEMCRNMPVGIGRRLKLTTFQLSALLPTSAFRWLRRTSRRNRRAAHANPGRMNMPQ